MSYFGSRFGCRLPVREAAFGLTDATGAVRRALAGASSFLQRSVTTAHFFDVTSFNAKCKLLIRKRPANAELLATEM